MSINIFQGSKQPKQTVNAASASDRAKAAKDALAVPSETSPSGSTAVGTKGTLQKIGNFVGTAAGYASKFLPGVGGMVAKVLSNTLNDPEWWQSVPGDAVTLNQALQPIATGESVALRPALAEILSGVDDNYYVLDPTDQQITQYLLPQIRKVVNAVPLQEASHYATCIRVNATLYALWRQLKKQKYIMTHGQTYLPSMNDAMFPLFQVENSAYLDALINRLEEYLRANVRLPHTLCEYLAWRYGRVYKITDSLKASLIMYSVRPMTETPQTLNLFIENLMNEITVEPARQAANTDLYNAYFDHDLVVEIPDHSQFLFDRKEFALRTNLDIRSAADAYADNPNAVYLDSALDNPTAFMASTVSTRWRDPLADTPTTRVLFPVKGIHFYMYGAGVFPGSNASKPSAVGVVVPNGTAYSDRVFTRAEGSNWLILRLMPSSYNEVTVGTSSEEDLGSFLTFAVVCKAMEIYNKDLLLNGQATADGLNYNITFLDVTAPAYDLAVVQDYTIQQEQVYAFANLVDQNRKHSLSYKQAEKLVTKEAAALTESLDIASVASPGIKATTPAP